MNHENLDSIIKDVDRSLSNIQSITSDVTSVSFEMIQKRIKEIESAYRIQSIRFMILIGILFILVIGVGSNVFINFNRIRDTSQTSDEILNLLKTNQGLIIESEKNHLERDTSLREDINKVMKFHEIGESDGK